MLSELWIRVRALARRRTMERELDDEMKFHFERQVEKFVRAGMTREEATRHARLEFGGNESVKEECREARGVGFVESLVQDVRFGARMPRKSPGFTLVAILTLALGIGASAAVFSVVNGILLRPLPYPDAERIAIPWLVSPPGVNLGSDYFPWSEIQFRFLTSQALPFEYLAAFRNDSFNLTGAGEPAVLDGFRTSADFFGALGVRPAIGRTYTAEEDSPGHEHEVVLSHRLWTERFGADASVLGRTIELNNLPYTVIGVMPAIFAFPRGEEMPASFAFPREAQLWVPVAMPPAGRPGPSEMAAIGRLKAGVSIAQAQADLNVITRSAEAHDGRWKGWFNMRLAPLEKTVVGGTQRSLLLILGSVGIVLLIACSNVANLLLARSFRRRKEFALRSALGAGRARLIRQLLTESVMLSMCGGLLSILLAAAAVALVKAYGPADIPRLHEASLDWRVLLFAIAVSLVTGILFGLAPAIGAARGSVVESLKEGDPRAGDGPAHPRLRNALLVSQVTLALVLVISAGLLVRTFYYLLQADPGFRSAQVLTFDLSLSPQKYPDINHVVTLYSQVLNKLRAVPGAESVGITETLPMGGEGESTVIKIVEHPTPSGPAQPFANYTVVSSEYFSAVGATILQGRAIDEADTGSSLSVAVVNEAFAKMYWPGEEAIGKQVALGSPVYPVSTVVGLVADIKHFSKSEDVIPEMYVPYTQKPWPSLLTMHVAMRTRQDPASAMASAREAVHAVDPDLPVAKAGTLAALLDDSMTKPRFSMLLLSGFAALALLLASVGMYGVISYGVAQRTREIGIRIALGAKRSDVFAMVILQGARVATLGIAAGLLIALGVTRLMTSFLYGVRPTDPVTYVAVSALLVGVALLACWIPARRAMKVDPMVALRHE